MTQPVPIRYVEPTQDSEALQKVARDVAKILTSNEEILYIAVQNSTALSIKKDSVVVTSNRIIGFSPGVLGRVSFHDYLWQDVLNVSMKQGMLSTEIIIETAAGKFDIGAIDKEQAKRLYGFAQQLEQEWREKRRVRNGAGQGQGRWCVHGRRSRNSRGCSRSHSRARRSGGQTSPSQGDDGAGPYLGDRIRGY